MSDFDSIQAVQRDAQRRKAMALYSYKPTKQDIEDAKRRQAAAHFECGDHQPDGSVLPAQPAPAADPYALTSARASVAGGLGISPCKQQDGNLVPRPQIAAAIRAMEESLQRQQQQRDFEAQMAFSPLAQQAACGILAVNHPALQQIGRAIARDPIREHETLVLRIELDMSRQDAQKLRASPVPLRQRFTDQLHREASWGLAHLFDINVEGVRVE